MVGAVEEGALGLGVGGDSPAVAGRDGRQVDGKSIMGILLLAAAKGAVITISADGIDEADALQSLAALVRTGFGEDTCSD